MNAVTPPRPEAPGTPDPRRWKALYLLSLAQFIVILDTSIVGVALTTFQLRFNLSQIDLHWIFNSYLIIFGSLLLLGGRLSDILGQRRIFVIGFLFLTLGSLVAGLATSGFMLIAARAVQGMGAAFIIPSALSIVITLFGNNQLDMNKAMGIWGGFAPAGATAGVLLGGILTTWFDWPWVFLINVPIGIGILSLTPILLGKGPKQKGSVDYPGSISVTIALILSVYVIVTANKAGWMSAHTIFFLIVTALSFSVFLQVQRHKKEPLLPLNIIKTHNLLSSNIVMALLGAAWIPMWFFLNLYLQQILGYDAFDSGIALLPITLLIMSFMILITPKMIKHMGLKTNLFLGMILVSASMFLFAHAPAVGGEVQDTLQSYIGYILPISLIAGLGMSLAYVAVLTSAISHLKLNYIGLGSGLVNTSDQVGAALGLAVLAAIAATQEETSGFHLAFIGAGVLSILASIISLIWVKNSIQGQ